jgi:hypothetical protein
VTFVSALFVAVIARSAFALAWRIARDVGQDTLSLRAQSCVALSSAWLATLCVATLRQSARVEVYAMAGAFAIGAIALLTARNISRAARVRLSAGLALLGLANHHFIAIFSAISLFGVTVAHVRSVGVKRAVAPLGLLLCVVGALYTVLPLRAHSPASLTHPQTLLQVLEVASAQTFLKTAGSSIAEPISNRLIDVLELITESITALGVVLALLGFAFAYRAGSTAKVYTTRLTLLIVFGVLGRIWLGFNRNNPDAAGYLLPTIVALAILLSGLIAGTWRALHTTLEDKEGPSPLARRAFGGAVFLVATGLPLYAVVESAQRTGADRASAVNTLALAPLTSLSPKSVIFLHNPGTIFRTRYAQLVEGERPDVTAVPVPLLGYPGMIPELIAKESLLAPIFGRYLLHPTRAISSSLIAGLATQRSVEIELDPDNVREYLPYAVPAGSFATVLEAPSTLADVRAAAARHFVRFDQIATQLDREPAAKEAFDEALLWMAFNDAVFFAARGARPEARRSIERAQQRAPQARHLQVLRELLDQTPGDGPVDVSSVLLQ